MAKYQELSKKDEFKAELETRNADREKAGLEPLEFDDSTVNDDLVALLEQDDEERPEEAAKRVEAAEAAKNAGGNQGGQSGKKSGARTYYFLKTRAYVSDRERWDRGVYAVDGEIARFKDMDSRSVEKLGTSIGQAKLHEIAKAMGISVHNGADSFRPDAELMDALVTERNIADINNEPIKPLRDAR